MQKVPNRLKSSSTQCKVLLMSTVQMKNKQSYNLTVTIFQSLTSLQYFRATTLLLFFLRKDELAFVAFKQHKQIQSRPMCNEKHLFLSGLASGLTFKHYVSPEFPMPPSACTSIPHWFYATSFEVRKRNHFRSVKNETFVVAACLWNASRKHS